MTETEPTEEVRIFAGNRIDKSGRRRHVWLPIGTTDDLWFKARGMYVVGGEYRVKVTRQTNGTTTRHGEPVYQGRHQDEATRANLEAQHRAAECRLRLAALERNDKRHSALDAATQPLCDLMRTLPPTDRDAVLTYVLRRLSRAW